jgi:hypothetical protein
MVGLEKYQVIANGAPALNRLAHVILDVRTFSRRGYVDFRSFPDPDVEAHKENTLKRSDLDDFVACYKQKNRNDRKESERFKSFTYEELTKRDKVNLDIFWLKDEALEESANLPAPEIIAADIAADLEAALEQFATIAEDLK